MRPLLFSLALAAQIFAQDAQDAAPRLSQVALFKNGLAMIVTEVDIPEGAEWVRVRPLPSPMHGTFWVTSSADSVSMAEVVATRDEVDEQVDAMTVTEILLANVGRVVVLTVGEDRYEGKLLSVPQDPIPQPSADRFASPLPPRADLVLIETANGVVALNRGSVARIAFGSKDGPPSTTWSRKRQGASLLLHTKDAKPGAKVVISYLERGLSWAPTYRMDVSNDGEGALEATATIVNDLLDMKDTPVLLISGFPNLAFAGVTSPLALGGSFDAFAQEIAAAPQMGMRRESVMTQQAVLSNAYQPEWEMHRGATEAMPGQAEEDMYFYELGKVTLVRGQRASIPLFTAKTPYKHVYRWEIPDYVNQYDAYTYGAQGQPQAEEVWHSLRMTNTLAMPWTTAPVLVTKGGRPLGQDTCFYTAPRAQTLVKVTKALGIHAEQREFETRRERDAERWGGYVYDRITIKAELVLTNYKDEKAEVEISKEFSGKMTACEPAGDVKALARGLRRLNPTNRLTWCVPVEAGQETKLTYEYEVLVRQ